MSERTELEPMTSTGHVVTGKYENDPILFSSEFAKQLDIGLGIVEDELTGSLVDLQSGPEETWRQENTFLHGMITEAHPEVEVSVPLCKNLVATAKVVREKLGQLQNAILVAALSQPAVPGEEVIVRWAFCFADVSDEDREIFLDLWRNEAWDSGKRDDPARWFEQS